MEVLYRDYNIRCRACVGSLVYILSTGVNLCFAVHKLEKCSSNPGKVNFEGLVHLLRYIWFFKIRVDILCQDIWFASICAIGID